jgi:hypothetical protein
LDNDAVTEGLRASAASMLLFNPESAPRFAPGRANFHRTGAEDADLKQRGIRAVIPPRSNRTKTILLQQACSGLMLYFDAYHFMPNWCRHRHTI